MKQFNLKTMALASAMLLGSGAFDAGAVSSSGYFSSAGAFSNQHHTRQFRGKKSFSVDDLSKRLSERDNGPMKEAVKDPSNSFNDIYFFDYLTAPDGSNWYYTVDYEYERIEHNEYWSEDIVHAFTFTIYDSSFKEVGKISDTIDLGKDAVGSKETRAVEVLLDPSVTKNFFNTDDNYEVMVFHAINTERYVNHYYNKVYSIGGEKDADGTDKALFTYEGRCLDAVNMEDGSGKENFIFTFVNDPDITWPENDPHYLDKLHALNYDIHIYNKAVDGNGPVLLFEKGVGSTRVPGDTTDGMYYISKVKDGKLYLIYSYYEIPYFNDPRGNGDDAPNPDNKLVIEVYSVNGDSASLVSTTKIPVEEYKVDGMLTYTYYSIGALAFYNDIDMQVNGSEQAPAFVVKRSSVNAANLEEELFNSYDIYGNDGKLLKNIDSNVKNAVAYVMPDGSQPQIMITKINDQEQYDFIFTTLYDGKEVVRISQYNDGDELLVPASIVVDKDGKLKYVYEMKFYDDDDEGNTYIRAAWYNADGTLDRIDRANAGKDVMAATINLDPVGLIPDLYDTDPAMEYAVLVKRTHGETTRNEFLIVDDNGDHFANFSADDGKGYPFTFTILPGTTNRLMMLYSGNNGLNVDIYDLPFINNYGAVEGVEESASMELSYDGSFVYAPGSKIEVYNASGILAANGFDTVSVESLAKGIYVVIVTDGNNKKKAVKINR